MKDLLSRISLKSIEEIAAAAKETIHRHRRRYLQRNLRPCPENCQMADHVGSRVVGCNGCKSPSATTCRNEKAFQPHYTKDELAVQFAELLRNPEALLRDYRDVTVFLWVLGAFDKQTKTVDEHIVSKVEKRDDKARKAVVGSHGGDPSDTGTGGSHSEPSDRGPTSGNA